ncbi:hypothetical protein [Ruegeria sp. SCP11]|uniref:hypothetical protein n=1 Tax=Ruegeria sp. SCP11 TaxID=3141378 RepID=UPI00333D11EF
MGKSLKLGIPALVAAPLLTVMAASNAAAAPEVCNWKTARDAANRGDYQAMCDCQQVTPSFLERLQSRSDFATTLRNTSAQCPGLAALLTDQPTGSIGASGNAGENRGGEQSAGLGSNTGGGGGNPGGGNPGDGGSDPGDGGSDPGDGGSDPGDGGSDPGDGGSDPGDGGGNGGNNGGPGNGNGNNGNSGNGGGNNGGSGPGTGNGGGNNGHGNGSGHGGGGHGNGGSNGGKR